MVGGNDKPGSVFGTALLQRRFKCLSVSVPIWAFGIVSITYLPMSGRIIDALLKASKLFIGIDMKVKFEYMSLLVVMEQLFKVVDLLIALRPDTLGYYIVHTLNQYIFIM